MKNHIQSLFINRNTLAFKIISRVLIISIIFRDGRHFSVYYFYTRNTIEEMTRNNAIFLAENTVNEIEEVVRPAAKLPENLAWMIEAGSLPKDSVLPFLTKLVRHNPTVYASAIAFEPYMFSPERKFFSPYAYRNNGKVDTTYLEGRATIIS
ncbi:MAG: hypothetical protein U5L09_15945 [Bacteroidales bacterium]|nr:hypothetical protein [Bacteroidales bacterium]